VTCPAHPPTHPPTAAHQALIRKISPLLIKRKPGLSGPGGARAPGRPDLRSRRGVVTNCSPEPTAGPAGSDSCGGDVRPIRETGEAALCETGTLAGDRRNLRPSGAPVVRRHPRSARHCRTTHLRTHMPPEREAPPPPGPSSDASRPRFKQHRCHIVVVIATSVPHRCCFPAGGGADSGRSDGLTRCESLMRRTGRAGVAT